MSVVGAGLKPAPTFLWAQSQCPRKATLFNLSLAVASENNIHVAGMPRACYCLHMANIQVKNIPEKLHNRLRRYAREQDCTLGDIILEAIEREVSRREWRK